MDRNVWGFLEKNDGFPEEMGKGKKWMFQGRGTEGKESFRDEVSNDILGC